MKPGRLRFTGMSRCEIFIIYMYIYISVEPLEHDLRHPTFKSAKPEMTELYINK